MEEQDENYIPKSIAEAHMYLDAYLNDKETFKNTDEDQATGVAHMTLGRWMRNTWFLWWSKELYERVKENSPEYPSTKPEIIEMFNDIGIKHADDMSGIIIKSYHRKLNNINYNMEDDVKEILQFYKDQEQNDNETELM